MNHDLATQIDHPTIDTRKFGISQHPIQSITFSEGSHVDECGSFPDHDTVLLIKIKIFEPGVFEPSLKFLRGWLAPSPVEPPGLYESPHSGIECTICPMIPRAKVIEETTERGIERETHSNGMAVEATDGAIGPPRTQFSLTVFKNAKKLLNLNQTRFAIRGVDLEGSSSPHQIDVAAHLGLRGRTPGDALKNKCEINGRNQEREVHAVCFRAKAAGRSFNSALSDLIDSR